MKKKVVKMQKARQIKKKNPPVIDTFIDGEVKRMGELGYSVIDLDDLAERILRQRDRRQKSDEVVRGWAFCHVRKCCYDAFKDKKAINNPHLAPQMTIEFGEFCPEFVPIDRDGKRKLCRLDYSVIYLEEINEVIAHEQKEVETKTKTIAALTNWRDAGIQSGLLRSRPAEAAD